MWFARVVIDVVKTKPCFQAIPETLRQALFELENHILNSSDKTGQELKIPHVYETINTNTKEFKFGSTCQVIG